VPEPETLDIGTGRKRFCPDPFWCCSFSQHRMGWKMF